MTTVLVPLDGSDFAERALPHAVPIARAADGRLRLVRACPPVPILAHSGSVVRIAVAAHAADLHDARLALERHAAALRAEGLVVDAVVDSGDAAAVIVAASVQADLVVMTTHGRGGLGRLVHGSVADEILHRAQVPVLLVPAAAEPTARAGGPRRVLVALDGSELAEASLGPAVELARRSGADLALLRVVDAPEGLGKYAFIGAERAKVRRYLKRLVGRLRAPGVAVAVHVRVGPTVPTILAAASALGADVVALGTHGRSGLSRLVMGSVATGLVEHATVPLLLVSAAAVRGAARSLLGAATGTYGRPRTGAA